MDRRLAWIFLAACLSLLPSCVLQRPVIALQECRRHTQCPADMFCTNGGYCRFDDGCVSDAQCGGDLFCMQDGACYEGDLDTSGAELFLAIVECAADSSWDGSYDDSYSDDSYYDDSYSDDSDGYTDDSSSGDTDGGWYSDDWSDEDSDGWWDDD